MIDIPSNPSDPLLDQLGAQLAAAEPAPAASPGEPEPVPVDVAAECEQLTAFAFDTLTPWYPATCAAWTPDKRAALNKALVPLATKYGFSLAGLFDRWGPEVGLAIVVIPMIGPTMKGLAADRAPTSAPEKVNTPIQPGAAPIATTVQPPPPADVNVPITPRFNLGENQVIGG